MLCCQIQQTPTGSSQQSPAAWGDIREIYVNNQGASVHVVVRKVHERGAQTDDDNSSSDIF